jgi:hypothetical protein
MIYLTDPGYVPQKWRDAAAAMRAHVAGGAPRDLLLEKEVRDVDLWTWRNAKLGMDTDVHDEAVAEVEFLADSMLNWVQVRPTKEEYAQSYLEAVFSSEVDGQLYDLMYLNDELPYMEDVLNNFPCSISQMMVTATGSIAGTELCLRSLKEKIIYHKATGPYFEKIVKKYGDWPHMINEEVFI